MPLSPDVPSLSSEDPNEVYDLTEKPDVVVRSAKLPRSSLSEYPDVQGGQRQNTDPVQPAKPSEPVVRRTLKEILDESPPNLSFERDPKYASLIDDWKDAEERAGVTSSLAWKIYGPGEMSDSLVRKTKEASKNLGKDAWKQIIDDQKRNWQCQVCLKSGDHISLDCPFLDYLPEGATVTPGIKVVCSGSGCQLKGEHDNTKCVKHAVRMS